MTKMSLGSSCMDPTVGDKMYNWGWSAWGWSTCGPKSDIATFIHVVWDTLLSCYEHQLYVPQCDNRTFSWGCVTWEWKSLEGIPEWLSSSVCMGQNASLMNGVCHLRVGVPCYCMKDFSREGSLSLLSMTASASVSIKWLWLQQNSWQRGENLRQHQSGRRETPESGAPPGAYKKSNPDPRVGSHL